MPHTPLLASRPRATRPARHLAARPSPTSRALTPLLAILSASLLLAGLAACAPKRATMTPEELARSGSARRDGQRAELMDRTRALMMRVAAEPADAREINVLVLSGGGDYGAFGAAFLRAWSERDGGGTMPRFDVVSGVSTGALIAPFAFLGTPDDLRVCEELYRNPKPDWVRGRGILALMPDNASLAEVPGLERELRAAMDMDFAKRLDEEGRRGRLLLVNTTDLDHGRAQAFELTSAAATSVAADDLARLHDIMLASAGIPGVFPPRMIDGTLYADGGVTSNILYGAATRREDTLGYRYRRAFPEAPPLKVRYWVIFNNQATSPAKTVQPGWLDVVGRSIEVAIRASTVTSLRHLYSFAESVTLRGDGEVEVRWVAIPDDWRPPVEGVFEKETMEDLANIGARLGADPTNWRTTPPDP